MEIWDAYYEDGTKANFDLIRDMPIKKGFYHIVCDILVKHVDKTYLLMQRDFNKSINPGKWESSAGGSVIKGETPFEGAKRELKEETGITAKTLKQIYRMVNKKTQCIYYGYIYITNCKKNSIILQQGETIDYKWINKNDSLDFINSPTNLNDNKTKRIKEILPIVL